MRKIFERRGRVEEVFISGKLNRWGNRFGFVRFCDVKNISKLESELDAIRIGSMKLYANLPRYRKYEAYHQSLYVPQKTRTKQQVNQGKVSQQWRVKAGQYQKADRRSKNADPEDSKQGWRGRIISRTPLKLPWLEDSWIGTTRDYMSMEVLREEMLQEGLGSIRVRNMDDKQVLLTAQDGVKLCDIIEINNEALSKIFEMIQPSSDGVAVGNKIVWTRCRGIPLCLWTVEYFKKIVWKVGMLVDVDETTLNWERLDCARLKVRLAVESSFKSSTLAQGGVCQIDDTGDAGGVLVDGNAKTEDCLRVASADDSDAGCPQFAPSVGDATLLPLAGGTDEEGDTIRSLLNGEDGLVIGSEANAGHLERGRKEGTPAVQVEDEDDMC